MDTTELLKRVRKIEIKTKGLSRNIFSGEYNSAFKGKGMSFTEVREYQPGDDIRQIDWNVTARFNRPYIKIFEEERELTFMLLIDVSGSRNFGSNSNLKKNIITEISAVLAFSAIQNNDKVGVIMFSDKIEKFIPPKKGTTHILRIIRELIAFKPESNGTKISEGLKYFTNVIKKRSTAFLISDFIDNNFYDALNIANKKHDIIALNIYDIRETELPPVGLIKFFDAETEDTVWIDSSDENVRENYKKWWDKHFWELNNVFKKSGVDFVSINTNESYIKPLINLFKRR